MMYKIMFYLYSQLYAIPANHGVIKYLYFIFKYSNLVRSYYSYIK